MVMEIVYRRAKTSKASGEGLVSLGYSSSSASTSKACGVQALPLLHVCHKKKLPPSGCHIDCMLEVALNYS